MSLLVSAQPVASSAACLGVGDCPPNQTTGCLRDPSHILGRLNAARKQSSCWDCDDLAGQA